MQDPETIKQRLAESLSSIPDPDDVAFARMVFARMDADGDGVVSPEEFTSGFREAFDFWGRVEKFTPIDDLQLPSADECSPNLACSAWGSLAQWSRKN